MQSSQENKEVVTEIQELVPVENKEVVMKPDSVVETKERATQEAIHKNQFSLLLIQFYYMNK